MAWNSDKTVFHISISKRKALFWPRLLAALFCAPTVILIGWVIYDTIRNTYSLMDWVSFWPILAYTAGGLLVTKWMGHVTSRKAGEDYVIMSKEGFGLVDSDQLYPWTDTTRIFSGRQGLAISQKHEGGVYLPLRHGISNETRKEIIGAMVELNPYASNSPFLRRWIKS